jgi:hypothetical protein
MQPKSETLSAANYSLLLPVGATIHGFTVDSTPIIVGNGKKSKTCVRVTHAECGHVFDEACAMLVAGRACCPNCSSGKRQSPKYVGKVFGRYTVVDAVTEPIGSIAVLTLRCNHCGMTGKRRLTDIAVTSKSKRAARFDPNTCKRCELIESGALVLPEKTDPGISSLDALLLEIRDQGEQQSYVDMLEA